MQRASLPGRFSTTGLSRGIAVGAEVAAEDAVAVPPVAAGQLESGSFDFTDSYEHDEGGFTPAFEDNLKGKYTISTGTPQTGGEFFGLKQRACSRHR